MAYSNEENNDLVTNETSGDNIALEKLLDNIAEALINSPLVDTTDVEDNQKFIRNGLIQTGQGSGVLALYQKDVKANVEDDLETIAQQIIGEYSIAIDEGIDDTVAVSIVGGGFPDGGEPITDLVFGEGNPLNVSQFIPLSQQQSNVDVEKAEEFLDTNIFELLPTGDTRQARIVRFFQELNALLPPNLPEFDEDEDGVVDRLNDGTWTGAEQYSKDNSISYAQDNTDGNIDEENAYFHRLKATANSTNQNRTIEDIYETIKNYLTDRYEPMIELEDVPEYENESAGYLQFRNPNQGIIIRNTNQNFIEGLNPSNPTWLTTDYSGLIDSYNNDGAPYDNTQNFILNNAGTGFTITMWVKFLDKVSEGTLFNYGNPTRTNNPFGFKLETYIVNRDDPAFFNSSLGNFGDFVDAESYFNDTLGLFQNTNSERFVRLQVREFGQDATAQNYDRGFRSSEVGNPTLSKYTWNAPELNKETPVGSDLRLLNNAHIPEDFNEWYFICASYNPSITEPNGESGGLYDNLNGYDLSPASNREAGYEPLFWLNHIDPFNGTFINNSGYGNKCKVEIISRTDLLRARGFKV